MNNTYILLCIMVMALVTYLIRTVPMVVFRKKITNRWMRSFLFYVPYSVLSAMTFPAVFSSTGSFYASLAGCGAALFLAYNRRSLLTVAIGAATAAFIIGLIV